MFTQSQWQRLCFWSFLIKTIRLVLQSKIEDKFRDSEEQNGFRAGGFCIDGVCSLIKIEKLVGRGKQVYRFILHL